MLFVHIRCLSLLLVEAIAIVIIMILDVKILTIG